jgi:hypothetical protein
VALLFAAFFSASAVAALLFAPLSGLGSARGEGAGNVVWVLLTASELLVAVALTTAFAGATVALTMGEVAA